MDTGENELGLSLSVLSGGIPIQDLLVAAKEAGLPAQINDNSLLNRCLLAGLVGALKGFSERELSPFLSTHKTVFPEIKKELAEIFSTLVIDESDGPSWLRESFEYGTKKVYHLEWKLYSSQELF
ncbi:hypothetical protein LEP1GSC047_3345 [Leptospira inadai serovar Lyme str. 10]|uniref:Uncharacterized protein n=2 Tax=Leptospira inadai serovar Lyme TaxID=293084 RepID=V6HHU4_9LEPT|nr:hypothetical protein [Leptospira inadai]EQA36090.1 hypothetical protein LEP1GSC047_3345 [Leptospira inadai serovar Lyme str. 10]PNV74880.1 hypothetical protein BES34_011440 [Leptospira inadai serovar Lyme]